MEELDPTLKTNMKPSDEICMRSDPMSRFIVLATVHHDRVESGQGSPNLTRLLELDIEDLVTHGEWPTC